MTHLDSHQHVHVLPGLFDLARTLAARYDIPFVRVPVERLRSEWPPSSHGTARNLGAIILWFLWMTGRPTGTRRGRKRFLRFLGFHDGGRLDLERLQRLLADLRPGETYELMCHPGLAPEEPDLKRWAYRHEAELHALTCPSIRSEIAARNVQLCSFKNLT